MKHIRKALSVAGRRRRLSQVVEARPTWGPESTNQLMQSRSQPCAHEGRSLEPWYINDEKIEHVHRETKYRH